MESLFIVLCALVLGAMLMLVWRDRKYLIEKEPRLFRFTDYMLWKLDKRIPFGLFLVNAVLLFIGLLAEIDLTEVDYSDPVNNAIIVVILFVILPFYALLLPVKKKK